MGNRFNTNKSNENEQKTTRTPIVWLDGSINQNQVNISDQIKLRTVFHDLTTFEEKESCEVYLQAILPTKPVVLIVSGRLGEEFVPRIHHLPHISTIYVFCMDEQKHKMWTRDFYKIRSVMTSLQRLIECIQSEPLQQNGLVLPEDFSFSLCRTSSDLIDWFRTPNDAFLYSFLLFRCLLQLDVINRDKSRLVLNSTDAEIIDKFKEHYSSNKALWYWTHPSIVSKLLKNALRNQDITLLIFLQFWLRDIELKLNENRLHKSIRVYRSLWLHRDQLNRLKNASNHYLMIRDLFSTSSDRNSALWLLDRFKPSVDTERVLLQIDADSALPGIAGFSQVQSINFLPEEVIFSLNSIFKLIDLNHNEDHLWTLHLVLCSPEKIRIDRILSYLKNQCGEERENSPLLFGVLLEILHEYNPAKQYDCQLLKISSLTNQAAHDIEKMLHDHQEEKQKCQQLPSTMPRESHRKTLCDARQYERIAEFESDNGDIEDAIKNYELAIEKWRQINDDMNPQLGFCSYRIASMYQTKGESILALKHYQIALNILKKTCPNNRDLIIRIGQRIINIYTSTGDFDAALELDGLLYNDQDKML